MTENPPTESSLDYPHLVIVSWRAIRRHHLSELLAVVAGEVVSLSFAIGRPFAWVEHVADLMRVTSVPKNKIYLVLTRLQSDGVIEMTTVGDGLLLTLLPPSRKYPWLMGERAKGEVAKQESQRLEAQLIHATRCWPQQAEMFGAEDVEVMREHITMAKLQEGVRESLVRVHQATAEIALSGRGINFPVMDRLPGGPAFTGLSSRGPTRPLGTGQSGGVTPDSDPENFGGKSTNSDNLPGTLKEYPGGTGALLEPPKSTLLGSSPLRVLKVKSNRELLDSETLKGGVPFSSPGLEEVSPAEVAALRCREMVHDLGPLDPGAEEEEILAWLRKALSGPVMVQWGAHWRLSIREDRRTVIEACYQLRLRVSAPDLRALLNRGGWLRDEYRRLRKIAARALQDRLSKPPEKKST